jgi:hypothetical protein
LQTKSRGASQNGDAPSEDFNFSANSSGNRFGFSSTLVQT